MHVQREESNSIHVALASDKIGWQAVGPTVAFTSVAFIAVLTRWYTRSRISRCIGLEDWAVAFSMILSAAYLGLVSWELQTNHSIGQAGSRMLLDTKADLAPVLAKIVLAGNTIYVVAVNTTKTSIVLLYLRVFRCTTFHNVKRICYIILLAIVIALSWGVFGGIFICHPIAHYITPESPGFCLYTPQAYWESTAAINIVIEFCIWFLPMPFINRMKLQSRRFRGLLAVFILGGFTCIVGVVRLVRVHVTAAARDFEQSGVAAVTWSAAELNTGIVCACLLVLYPLLKKLMPKTFAEQRPAATPEQVSFTEGDSLEDSRWSTGGTLVSNSRNNSIWSKIKRRTLGDPKSVTVSQEPLHPGTLTPGWVASWEMTETQPAMRPDGGRLGVLPSCSTMADGSTHTSNGSFHPKIRTSSTA